MNPYTIETLRALGKQGVESVDIICPGFSADCLETIEEIEEENKDAYLEAGGKHYHYIPALNDRADHIEALGKIISHHTMNWGTTQGAVDLAARAERAKKLGAQK